MSGYGRLAKGAVNLVDNERGNSTRTLLLALFLLIAGAGYLYFFTDIIRPDNGSPKPLQSPAAPEKKPLPPRPDQQAEGLNPAKPEAVTVQTNHPSQPVSAATPAKATPDVKPAAPVAQPARQEQTKGAKPALIAKPAPIPAGTKAAPQLAKPLLAKAEPPKVKLVVPKSAKETSAPAKKTAAARSEKKVVKKLTGSYTLLIGDFVPDKTLTAVLTKLKKNGIDPVKNELVSATEPMNRLYVGEYTDQDIAVAELQKLKKLTEDAFIIAEGSYYSLYAGSYFTASRLKLETIRLAAKGVKTVVRTVPLKIMVTRIRAGNYASLESARKAAHDLNSMGLKVSVVKSGT
jgi:SPOR domain